MSKMLRNIKIVHGPKNPSSQATINAQTQKEIIKTKNEQMVIY